jgi:hypothetical protein
MLLGIHKQMAKQRIKGLVADDVPPKMLMRHVETAG